MITLALYQKMLEDKVAGLTPDEFFWEELPLGPRGTAHGVWLVTRPGNIDRSRKGLNLRSTVDIYVALANKAKTEEVHQEIRHWLTSHMCFCQLEGSVGNASYSFSNVRLRPATTPQNGGATENGLIVKIASVEVIYDDDLQITLSN